MRALARRLIVPAVLAAAGCGATRVVDRADDGTPILVCGDQPDTLQLERIRRLHGVRTVLNLRGEHPGEPWFEEERRAVEAVGARWAHLDASSHEAPPPEDRARFFDLVENPANWPVYAHCQSGMHRTGLYCALYRRQYQGWDAGRTIAEMRAHGFGLGGDREAAERFIREYEPDPGRTIDRSARGGPR